MVVMIGLSASYELRAVTDDPPQRGPILSALHGHIVDVFNEYGVQIMTPAYERDPETPKVVAPRDWYATPAARGADAAPVAARR